MEKEFGIEVIYLTERTLKKRAAGKRLEAVTPAHNTGERVMHH
jgi:hypothetical protein